VPQPRRIEARVHLLVREAEGSLVALPLARQRGLRRQRRIAVILHLEASVIVDRAEVCEVKRDMSFRNLHVEHTLDCLRGTRDILGVH
jgi:hypothetical protein